MKKTLTLAGALISAAALTLTSCAEPPGTGDRDLGAAHRHWQCHRWR